MGLNAQFRADLGVLTADGQSSFVFWSGGIGAFVLEPAASGGTLGSGTLTLQYASGGDGDDADVALATRLAFQVVAFDATNTTVTALGVVAITGPEGYYRMSLTGATGPNVAGYLRPAGPKGENVEVFGT